MVVYKVTNMINDKVYIGQTSLPLHVRWKLHMRDCDRAKNNKFYNAIKEFGEDKFFMEVLEECSSKEELLIREEFWVRCYDSYVSGYNSTPGGSVSPMKFKEAQTNLSSSIKGRKFSADHCANLSKAHKGKVGTPHTDEHKKYISEILKGRKKSKEHVEKMRSSQLGKKQSLETRRKRSDSMKGKKFTDEHKSRISASLKSNGNVYVREGLNNPRSKPILQISLGGCVINRFESVNKASLHLGKKSCGDISSCANGVKIKTAYGFKWVFESDYVKNHPDEILPPYTDVQSVYSSTKDKDISEMTSEEVVEYYKQKEVNNE